MTLPSVAVSALAPYLGRQRWYAGAGEPDPSSLRLVTSDTLAQLPDGRELWWAVVDSSGVRYQLLLGASPAPAALPSPAALPEAAVPEAGVVGQAGEWWLSDAVTDHALMLAFYELVVGSSAQGVRVMGVEQSNTSLVYDEAVILKLFRRLADGTNPDIELTGALGAGGFEHVARPVATWRRDGVDLAFAQRFLAGGSEGWALAVASVRALIAGAGDGSGDTAVGGGPGDFSADAAELGRVTAGLHLALAAAFGTDSETTDSEMTDSEAADSESWEGRWPAFVDGLEARLRETRAATGEEGAGEEERAAAFARLRNVKAPGPAVRLHGDYHLGQVMRAGGRWYVLDFEGEPTRGLEERRGRQPVAKDVGGMLRSFDYAARYALIGGGGLPGSGGGQGEAVAAAWEQRNRTAFLDGYLGTPGVEAVTAAPEETSTVFGAFELDKALYELAYEESYRPEWVVIPRAAIGRILERLAG